MPRRITRELPSLAGSPTPGTRIRSSRSHSFEIYHQPSESAQRLWFFPRVAGKAKVKPSFLWHPVQRDGLLLHYVTKGRLWHRIQNVTHVAHAGDACLMDLRAEPRCGGTPGDSGPIEFDWVLFNGRGAANVLLELRADRKPIFGELDDHRTRRLFGELISLMQRRPPAFEVKMAAVLVGLLAELFAARGHQPVSLVALAPPDQPFSDAVRKAIDSITAFYHLPGLSMKHLHNQLHLNMSYFTRRFHKEVGMSPKAYLIRYRVEQAKALLETNDSTIDLIARSVGFTDQNYFARQFRKITGISPRQYRRAGARADRS